MARPTLSQSPKYKLLVHRLRLPQPYVRGLLEVMWDSAHSTGNPVLGPPEQVEAAAEWPGDFGMLFTALRDCRLIDEVEPGVWAIHDYWDHAPDYVRKRAVREADRKHAYSPRQRPQTAEWRGKAELGCLIPPNSELGGQCPPMSELGCPPSPTPFLIQVANGHPGHLHGHANSQETAKADGNAAEVVNGHPVQRPPMATGLAIGGQASGQASGQATDGHPGHGHPLPLANGQARPVRQSNPADFDQFWAAYPRKEKRVRAVKAWQKLKPDPDLLAVILQAIQRQKRGRQWQEGFIPHPATWLNDRRWEDETPGPGASGNPAGEDRRRQAHAERERLKREEEEARRQSSPFAEVET